jgi:hypothetical protein
MEVVGYLRLPAQTSKCRYRGAISASNHRASNGVGPEGLEPSTYGLKVRSSAY